ncbi:MAG: hypothetical protein LBH43_18080 [Treponema sp.]|jgi:hypothetical protein|nr:hypothetical protein [Treponema sp.]
MGGKGKPFEEDDSRQNREGRPKKKTLQDIINSLGAIIYKDESGKELSRYEGNDRLLREIVDVGIKEKNPAMMKFIYQHMNTPQADPELASVKLAAERARAAKLEIANAKARGELISRNLVSRVLGKIYAIDQSIFLAIGPTTAGVIAAETGIKSDEVKLRIEEIITQAIYQGITAEKRIINDFLLSFSEMPITDTVMESKPKTRQPKKVKP